MRSWLDCPKHPVLQYRVSIQKKVKFPNVDRTTFGIDLSRRKFTKRPWVGPGLAMGRRKFDIHENAASHNDWFVGDSSRPRVLPHRESAEFGPPMNSQ